MEGWWLKNVHSLQGILERLSARNGAGEELRPDSGLIQWQRLAFAVKESGGTVFFIGNGASASMASHLAADMAKNLHVRTMVFTDAALVTALGNDLGFEEVYAAPLRLHMKRHDMLVAISSSGRSSNIVRAVKEARSIGGKAVTLSAMDRDNAIRNLGDLNFYLPADTYGMAETGHAAILHFWMDMLLAESVRTSEGAGGRAGSMVARR